MSFRNYSNVFNTVKNDFFTLSDSGLDEKLGNTKTNYLQIFAPEVPSCHS